jgi:alkylhydroperoxidase family enzyme
MRASLSRLKRADRQRETPESRSELTLRVRRRGRTLEEVTAEVRELLRWMEEVVLHPPGEASREVARELLQRDGELFVYLRGYELRFPEH